MIITTEMVKELREKTGAGWGGWYKDFFFRSLRELSYVINVLEKENHKWECAEKKLFTVKYINYDGRERTHRPDFFVDDNLIVEIKPKRLIGTPAVNLKEKAMLDFCREHNYNYLLTDVELLNFIELEKLFNTGVVKFTNKTIIKFNKWKTQNEK